ncbi:MAG TPA: amino acid adenylation domain-containing protein [Gemmatimonadales bacterium]|nr:amino acid adenylation domain-containing protein [Gemmatimonadales bacterium]
MAVDTACSSSLMAVHLACRSLRAAECQLALAGGVNVVLSPAHSIAFTKAGVLAPDGRCKVFDARADGYVRGEGAGLVVLKPLAQALGDGDAIYCVIRGSAVHQDGRTNGLMAPSRESQEAVLRDAYRDAGVSPTRVQYVEAHGTGTLLGDSIEARALGAVIGSGRPGGAGPCLVGSVKSNVGHLEAAAGIAGLVKVALALKERAVPPSLHFATPNPHVPFEELGLRVQQVLTPWPEHHGAALAGVSSFGFGGTNVHVVLEEAPPGDGGDGDPQAPEADLLPLSAHTPEALAALAGAHRELLSTHRSDDRAFLDDVCAATGRRCNHLDHRVALIARSTDELIAGLDDFLRGITRPGVVAGRRGDGRSRLAFVFSGQGSQWPGMGRALLREEPVFRQAVERCDRALRPHVDWSLLEQLESAEQAAPLAEIDVVQPTLFALQVALAALWRSWGVAPDAVVGHSMGEVAAAYVAGALGLEDAARVICMRSRLLRRLSGRGGMAVVGLSLAETARALSGYERRVSIAGSNSPRSTVVAGDTAALAELAQALERKDVFCSLVNVDVASHSPQTAPLGDELRQGLAGLEPRPAWLPFVSTVTGAATGQLDAGYWARNLTEPVNFTAAIEELVRTGHTTFLEISPHPVLQSSVQQGLIHLGAQGTVLASTRRDEPERSGLLQSLAALYAAGRTIAWTGFYPPPRHPVVLPGYPWQRERFWLDAAGAATPWPTGGADQDGRAVHPLLGQRAVLARYPGASLWQSDLDADRTIFLRDHRVNGEIVLPAAAFAEMALAAAASSGVSGTHALVDLDLRRTLVLPVGERRTLQVALVPGESQGTLSFTVHSKPVRGEPEAWTLHATATFVPERAGEAPEPGDLAAMRREIAEEVPRDEVYQALATQGLDYGPTLRGIERVWRRNGEALGCVSLTELLRHETDAYQIHPAVLDAALQVLAATAVTSAGQGSDDCYVPVGCRRVRLDRRPAGGETLWSHTVLEPGTAPGASELRASLRLFDDSGGSVAELTGLRLARVGVGRRVAAPALAERDTWLYRVRWQQAAWPAGDAAGDLPEAGSSRWLILADRDGLAAALQRQLEARGQLCVLLPLEDSEAAAAHAIRQRLEAERSPLRGVIHLWSTGTASLQTAQTLGCNAVLHLVQSLVMRGAALGSPQLWLVTRGTQPVLSTEPADIAQAPLWGLGRTIAFELPELKCTLVDLDPAVDATAAATLLARQLGVADAEDQVALRAGHRWVPRLVPLQSCADGPEPLRDDGTYLITGGLGGLGLAVVGWMIEQGARHLVLVGRSAPSQAALAAVERMRRTGAEVAVLSADVAAEAELTRVLERIRGCMPPLRGIVHAAGVLENAPLMDLDTARMAKVLAPKVTGAWNLHAATLHDQLDFFVLFSSAVSVLGSPGQGNYAAANTFLDVLAHYRHRQGLPAVSINWGPWAEIGLVASGDFLPASARSGTQGVKGITPERGLEALGRALRSDGAQLTVLPFDIASLLELYPTAAQMPFFADVGGKETHVSRLYARPSLHQEYVAPRNEIERRLAELWRQTLRIDRVGVRDSFFELGGDSVLAAQIVTSAHKAFGVRIDLREAFQAFTIEQLAQRLEAAGHVLRLAPRSPDGGVVPLSFVQERQLFLELLDPLTAVNNLAMCVRIEGSLDLARLTLGANRLLARHEALRTSFQTGRGRPGVTIAPSLEIDLGLVDLRAHEPDRLAEAVRLATLEARRPFELDQAPLLRVRTFRLALDSHVLVVVIHHTIADGWSLGVFLRELFSDYRGSLPPPLPIQYADFAAWQRQSLDGPLFERQLSYWKHQLGGELPVLDLPIDRPRPARQTFAGATHRFHVPADLTGAVRALSRRHDATPFMTLVAAFQALLHRWCGQDDILVGTPTAGRTHPETEPLIGAFINTLVLRTDLSGDPSFAEVLSRLRAVALAAYAHQDLPFEKLVAELRPQRDLSRTPIFQVMFILQNTPLPSLQLPELSLQLLPLDRGAAQFDLTLIVTESEDGLEGAFEYNTDLFEASTIERLGGAYQLLLADAIAHPEQRISRLSVMTEVERHYLVSRLNETRADYPRDACVHELFEAQVAQTPDAVAVIAADGTLTYRELDRRAGALALDLRDLGVGPDVRVGVCLERSVDLVPALLAVQKAGGAYVPIDPATPQERALFMLRDAGARVLLTDGPWDPGMSDGVVVHRVGKANGGGPRRLAQVAYPGVTSEHLAYVIYTSGSTGEPKGVCIRHRALVNLLWSMRRLLGPKAGDRLLAVTSVSFDIAALELYLPLIAGATVVLASRNMTVNSRKLQDAIAEHGVNLMQATPATWRMMLQGGWLGAPALMALCGGEPLSPELADQLLRRVGSLWNLYGPTETTVWSAASPVRRGQFQITIGLPLANTQLHVLDARLQPVPTGARGELYIGGDGVSPGYVNRPDLTAERFVPNPFGTSAAEGDRLFRTGDWARRLPDGSIEVLGRLDDQVKIHGFRIEPGEIESALRRHPSVCDIAVVARGSASGDKHLVACIVPAREPAPDPRELRAFLRGVLPAYMVPAVFDAVSELPLTPAGKVDRRALAAGVSPSSPAFVAPRTPAEETLAAIYAQVLGIDRVGIHDNFFDLGGGSIQILEIIVRAQADGLHLTPDAFFEYQTVAELAAFVSGAA